MDTYSIRQQNRMVNSLAFLRKYASQWPAGSRPLTSTPRLAQTIADITATGAAQSGGERAQKGGTASKSAIFHEVNADVLDISRTAKLIGKDENDPDFAPKFALPNSKAIERVIQTATDFSKLLATDATWAKFTDEGMRADLRAELSADLAAYPTARNDQAAGRLNETGATEDIADLVHQGAALIDGLDTYFRNFYARQPLKLDEWKTASRLERAPQRSLTP